MELLHTYEMTRMAGVITMTTPTSSEVDRRTFTATSLTSRLRRRAVVTEWAWWRLPPLLRWYVAATAVGTLGVVAIAAASTDWRLDDIAKFLLLMCCGMISTASTPRIACTSSVGLTRDFTTIWVLPTAILLPPVYVALVPIPYILVMQLCVHRGIVYQAIFAIATISLSYVLASVAFRCFPASFAGGTVGSGLHACTWVIALTACYVMASRVQHFMIVGAAKLSNPKMRIWQMEWNRDALQGLFVESDLAVLITLAVGISPTLVVLALPTVLLVRRFLVHPLLIAQSRSDSKTGLLNVPTWEAEAESEISRSVRTRNPVSLALVDIDHFKLVNDTYGHLVGDKVLKAVAEGLTTQSRDYDRAGRFGGEEFVLLMAQTTEAGAMKIAERLRGQVESLAVPVDDRADSPVVKVTISIGVTALTGGETRELTDLLAAADSALYTAKQGGRNRVAAASPDRSIGMGAFNADLAASPSHPPSRSSASGGGAASPCRSAPPAGTPATGGGLPCGRSRSPAPSSSTRQTAPGGSSRRSSATTWTSAARTMWRSSSAAAFSAPRCRHAPPASSSRQG
jgi:diguanylate cyclase (GGDEF)-like protein